MEVFLAVAITFFARAIGFVRESIMAAVFGTSSRGDAFIVAFSAPDLLVSSFTFAIGALYIPTYLRIENDEKKSSFNSGVLLLVFLLCLAISAVVFLMPSVAISLMAGGMPEATKLQAVEYLRVMVWATIPIGIGGVFKAFGQMKGRYSLMMLLEMFINAFVIAGLVVSGGEGMLTSYAFLLGTCVFALSELCVIGKLDYRLNAKGSLNNPHLKILLVGILPIFMSSAIAEINTIVDKNFASNLIAGSISSLHYASKVVNLVTAIIGTAVTSVLFPGLSKKMVKGDEREVSDSIFLQNILILACVLPIFYLVIFNSPFIVRVLFARKSFGADSIKITSECLIFYALAIPGRNLKSVWIRVYNALLDTKALALNAFYALIFNVAMNFLLMPVLKHGGLALATSLSSIFTCILLATKYSRRNAVFSFRKLLIRLGRILALSLVYIPSFLISRMFQTESLLLEFVVVGATFAVASGIYLFLLYRFAGVEIGKGRKIRLKGLHID